MINVRMTRVPIMTTIMSTIAPHFSEREGSWYLLFYFVFPFFHHGGWNMVVVGWGCKQMCRRAFRAFSPIMNLYINKYESKLRRYLRIPRIRICFPVFVRSKFGSYSKAWQNCTLWTFLLNIFKHGKKTFY